MGAAEDNLFNPNDGLPVPVDPNAEATSADPVLADELALDRHQVLVEGDDGLPARKEHLDLLLNFPVAGVIRALSAGYEEKAGRVLGHASPAELIATAPRRRGASIREWYERQLRGLGYDQFATEVIRSHKRNAPLYDLLLASRVERAVDFFREATKRGPAGPYMFDV